MTIVEQIVGGQDGDEHQHQHDDGDSAVGLRLLHSAAVFVERGVGREFLIELRVDSVVVVVELPLVQRERSYGGLVAHVEQRLVVGREAVVQPVHFGRNHRWVAQHEERVGALRIAPAIVLIEALPAGVGKEEGALVGAVDVGEIGRVGIDVGLRQEIVVGRLSSCCEA